ncbi:hypothetical protein RIF29_20389 [Crotalaria pallida]|uniref:Secreted protein n=1 Tax=Crotalaria pallida TaxID=3830 RepID=A0AAN9F2F9_CROPI
MLERRAFLLLMMIGFVKQECIHFSCYATFSTHSTRKKGTAINGLTLNTKPNPAAPPPLDLFFFTATATHFLSRSPSNRESKMEPNHVTRPPP